MSSESLNQLFATYRRLRDCLKIAGRAVDAENLRMLEGTEFVGQAKVQATQWIEETRRTVDDLSIVALWALFERYVIEFTQERTRDPLPQRILPILANAYKRRSKARSKGGGRTMYLTSSKG